MIELPVNKQQEIDFIENNIGQQDSYLTYIEEDKTVEIYEVNQAQASSQHKENDSDNILSYLSNQHHPGDIRNVLSCSKNNHPITVELPEKKTKSKINSTEIAYTVSNISTKDEDSLIDRGTNGGLAGDDIKIICDLDLPRHIDVSGKG